MPRMQCLAAGLSAAFAASAIGSPSDLPMSAPAGHVEGYPHRKVTPVPEVRLPQPSGPGTRIVNNCLDSGSGSLREAVANANDMEVIDLTQLQCSEISLFSGEIPVLVDNLTILGPGADALTIDGNDISGYYNRIFRHPRIGRLKLVGVTLTDTRYVGDFVPKGGCIYSSGSVSIVDSRLTDCIVKASAASNSYALGGAIYARGDISVDHSVVSGSTSYSASHGAYGGGLFGRGNLSVSYSTIANNTASAPYYYSAGGGLEVLGTGDVTITASTLSGNAAFVSAGAEVATSGSSTVVNSTIAYNYAVAYVGGATFRTLTISNSTITRNSSGSINSGVGLLTYQPLTANSTIIADNMDVYGVAMADVLAPSISGAHNLIVTSSTATPDGTIRACPRLTSLANHGGSTLTETLVAGSPGIDAGSNDIPVDTDQRGGVFARVYGARADAGATEWQGEIGEEIFKSAFETRCDDY